MIYFNVVKCPAGAAGNQDPLIPAVSQGQGPNPLGFRPNHWIPPPPMGLRPNMQRIPLILGLRPNHGIPPPPLGLGAHPQGVPLIMGLGPNLLGVPLILGLGPNQLNLRGIAPVIAQNPLGWQANQGGPAHIRPQQHPPPALVVGGLEDLLNLDNYDWIWNMAMDLDNQDMAVNQEQDPLANEIPHVEQNPVQVPHLDLQAVVVAVSAADPHLNLYHQQRALPLLQTGEHDDLNPFQRMLRCLLLCVSTAGSRAIIYERVRQRCQPLVVNPQSINNFTDEALRAVGVRAAASITWVRNFAMHFGELDLQMDDGDFMVWMVGTIGVNGYTAFTVNVIGRRRYNFLPPYNLPLRRANRANLELRQALRRFDANELTPTNEQAIQRFAIWETRRGIAAYMIWTYMMHN
ncbi:hypothetical protein POM88_033740 [Heracleum sosnowskyi]|uniref:Uncharacterized protein n=1 Tax=Heracleum sosnowskyi TaxID=360622 RepID=A0AAD8HJV5_9APIA|nr:hypothetical protein POM88_033740 [Heracleum sosnowskyi]